MRHQTLALRHALVRYAHLVYAKGWVANHDGNLTARIGEDRILATPTAMSKGDIALEDLIVVNLQGERVAGRRRPFSELALHLAVYRQRPDVMSVVHAHPPHATAMSVAGLGLDRPILAEAVVSLGDRVPLVPFAMPKSPEWAEGLERASLYYDAVMMENHGVIAYGVDPEQAFLRLELVEHLATITHRAMAFGGPRPLAAHHIPPLLAARKRAGLGPEARGLALPPRDPNAAAPQHSTPSRERIRSVLLEELRKLD